MRDSVSAQTHHGNGFQGKTRSAAVCSPPAASDPHVDEESKKGVESSSRVVGEEGHRACVTHGMPPIPLTVSITSQCMMILICEAKPAYSWKTDITPFPCLTSDSLLKALIALFKFWLHKRGTLYRHLGTTIFFPGEKGLGIQYGLGQSCPNL